MKKGVKHEKNDHFVKIHNTFVFIKKIEPK